MFDLAIEWEFSAALDNLDLDLIWTLYTTDSIIGFLLSHLQSRYTERAEATSLMGHKTNLRT